MIELIKRAAELLGSESVKVVIGYGQGSAERTRAIFVTQAADCEKLVFNSHCIHNLAVYLTKPEIKKMGKPAIVAPVPVLRSILQLAAENQLVESDLVILGITPESQLIEFNTFAEIETFLSTHQIVIDEKYRKTIETIKSMPVASNVTPAGAPALCAIVHDVLLKTTSRSGYQWPHIPWETLSGTSCGPCTLQEGVPTVKPAITPVRWVSRFTC